MSIERFSTETDYEDHDARQTFAHVCRGEQLFASLSQPLILSVIRSSTRYIRYLNNTLSKN